MSPSAHAGSRVFRQAGAGRRHCFSGLCSSTHMLGGGVNADTEGQRNFQRNGNEGFKAAEESASGDSNTHEERRRNFRPARNSQHLLHHVSILIYFIRIISPQPSGTAECATNKDSFLKTGVKKRRGTRMHGRTSMGKAGSRPWDRHSPPW